MRVRVIKIDKVYMLSVAGCSRDHSGIMSTDAENPAGDTPDSDPDAHVRAQYEALGFKVSVSHASGR